MTDNKKRWKDHAEFLGDMADRVAWLMVAQGADKTEAVNEYTRWLSEQCFKHAERHCREDFDNGFYVPEQPVDEPLVDGISVSGNRAKKDFDEPLYNPDDVKFPYYGEDSWKSAMKEHHGGGSGTTINEKEKDDVSYCQGDKTPSQADIASHCDLCDEGGWHEDI